MPSCRGWWTPPTNGSRSAPASASGTSRPSGETTSDMGLAGRARGAGRGRRRCAIDRPDRARHLDPRQHLSGERGLGPGRTRHHPWRGLRSAGGMLGLRVRACDRRRPAQDRRLQARAGDRLGDLLAHPRLERPRHLRAVRRRRRRGGGGGADAARHPRGPRRSHRRICAPTAATSPSSMSTAARPRPRPSGTCAWKAARCSSTRWR